MVLLKTIFMPIPCPSKGKEAVALQFKCCALCWDGMGSCLIAEALRFTLDHDT